MLMKMVALMCRPNGELLEEVDSFKYLRSQVAADGECGMDVVHRNRGV